MKQGGHCSGDGFFIGDLGKASIDEVSSLAKKDSLSAAKDGVKRKREYNHDTFIFKNLKIYETLSVLKLYQVC